MRSAWLATAALIGVLTPSLGSQAATVTWEFEAVVRDRVGTPDATGPSDLFTFFVGQPLRGSLSFEVSTTDSIPSARLGLYNGAVTAISIRPLTFLGEPFPPAPDDLPVAAVPASSQISVSDTLPATGAPERLLVHSDLQAVPPGPNSSPTTIRRFDLQFVTLGPDSWTSDALPLVPPSLSLLAPFDPAWDTLPIPPGLFLSSADNQFRVAAELTLLHAVPEPLALPLFAIALLVLLRSAYPVACCFAQR